MTGSASCSVDDEPVLLEALRDAMRVYRRRWQVEFAPSGEAALELLAAQPVEVVIADMQMPSMDGATLLTHIRELYPTTIRMVLSGHATPRSWPRPRPSRIASWESPATWPSWRC